VEHFKGESFAILAAGRGSELMAQKEKQKTRKKMGGMEGGAHHPGFIPADPEAWTKLLLKKGTI